MGYLIRSQTELESDIRTEAGSLDTDLLSATELTRCLSKAVSRLNELNPRIGVASITTVEDQQDYLVWGSGTQPSSGTWIENILAVLSVLYDSSSAFEVLGDITVDLFGITSESGLSLWDNPSLVEIYYRKLRDWRKRLCGTAEVISKVDSPNSGEVSLYIRLMPSPSESDKIVPFEYAQARTLSDMESKFEPMLIDLAVGYCMKLVGNKLNMATDIRIGGRYTKISGNSYIKDGEERIRSAENRLRVAPRMIRS